MNRMGFWAIVLIIAWVAYNICTRETGPIVHADILLPFLEGHEVIGGLVGLLLLPGSCVLWYLGLSLHTRIELIVATLFSWWAYLIAVRVIRRVLFLQS